MPTRPISFAESVTLLALLISLIAFSIDAMLPALPQLGADLGAAHPNDTPLVIMSLFAGIALGQLIAGPISDSLGRRPVTLTGVAIFLAGSAICALSRDFTTLLIGRAIQGFGAAGPRVMATAIVRDRSSGDAMARTMSFIMSVFILVPVVAPLMGQGLAYVSGWRAIFGAFLALGSVGGVWFLMRHPETLPPERRVPFSLARIWAGIRETCCNRYVLCIMLAAGLVYGALVAYLGSAQPIIAEQYGQGALFPVYFGIVAMSVGSASLLNAKLVMRLGMHRLIVAALVMFSLLSAAFLAVSIMAAGHPPFGLLIGYLLASFFALGILFGNLNAAAMEPLGHIAGLASAAFGSIMTLISLAIGVLVGRSYDSTVLPLVGTFTGLGVGALLLVILARWSRDADA